MSRLRFYLNNTLLQDEPDGTDDAEIVIKRDDELRGLLYSYSTSLVFWGDGYEIIQAALLNEGPCATLSCRIEEQCGDNGAWQLLYNGRVLMMDCEFNYTRCTVETELTDENYSALIQRNKDAEITLNGGDVADNRFTPGGIALNDIGVECQFHNKNTGAYDWAATVYPVKDALDYIVRYLTENEVTVSSTYLTAGNFQPAIWEIDFNLTPPGSADAVDLTFVNSYGQTVPIGPIPVPITDASPALQYFQFLRGYDVSGNVNGENYMDQYFIFGENLSATKMSLWAWTKDVNILSVVVTNNFNPPYNAIVTQTQTFDYTGAYPFVVANMRKVIQDNTRPVITTFKQLMQTLIGCFGIGYRYTNNGSGPVMQVEQINTFFDNTAPSITLNNVNELVAKTASALIYNKVVVGEDNAADEKMFRPETWLNPFCLGDKLDAQRPYKATAVYTTSSQEDYNVIVHVEPDGGGDWQTVNHVEKVYDNLTVSTTVNRNWYNAPLIHMNCLYKNERLYNGDLKKDGLTYQKTTADPTLGLQYEFEYPLSNAQVQALLNDPLNYVAFDGRTGWIEEVRIAIKDKMTKFVLLSELP